MTRRIGIFAGAAVLSGLLLVPGHASAGDTTVNVVVANGALTISAQPSTTTLTGAQFNVSLPSTATGAFGEVTVLDGRGLGTPWTLTAASTDYVGVADSSRSIVLSAESSLVFQADESPTVGPNAGAATCTAQGGSLTASGTGTAIASGASTLTQLDPVTCTIEPGLRLRVPPNTPAQTYRGVVTLTVA